MPKGKRGDGGVVGSGKRGRAPAEIAERERIVRQIRAKPTTPAPESNLTFQHQRKEELVPKIVKSSSE
jgi:hypothetical protein